MTTTLNKPSPIARTLLAISFVAAGCMHFIVPHLYLKIMPPALPQPMLLIFVSGIAEVLGGIGLLVPFTRRAAAYGLVLLLIAVFPANIYSAVAHVPAQGILGNHLLQWLRLPLQLPLIWWAWQYTKEENRKDYT